MRDKFCNKKYRRENLQKQKLLLESVIHFTLEEKHNDNDDDDDDELKG
jgi:hypothetical protein